MPAHYGSTGKIRNKTCFVNIKNILQEIYKGSRLGGLITDIFLVGLFQQAPDCSELVADLFDIRQGRVQRLVLDVRS